jgi:spore maturation protein SpmB
VLAYLGTLSLAVAGLIWWLTSLPPTEVNVVSTVMSSLVLFGLIIGFIGLGLVRGINIYENFIEGAKEGFQVAITIIPYLVAMLVAIGVFRAAGAMELLMDGIRWLVQRLGLNADFVEALPTALMKPLSGSGARGMMLDAMKTHGADSFVGRVASTIQGSTETTFYILAVYFGSVGIKRTRYALAAGLLADLAGVLAAIVLGYVFFGGAATP